MALPDDWRSAVWANGQYGGGGAGQSSLWCNPLTVGGVGGGGGYVLMVLVVEVNKRMVWPTLVVGGGAVSSGGAWKRWASGICIIRYQV